MRYVLLCVLSGCVLASFAFFGGPAQAGGYSGYHQTRVWYTSGCCYRKVVRRVTTVRTTSRVRYVRIDRHDVPYRYGYYTRPYDAVRFVAYDDYWRGLSYRYANFVPAPDCRLVRIANLDGTWDWARRAGCF